MVGLLVLLFVLISGVTMHHQTDYIFISERAEVLSANKSLVEVDVHNFKFNRTAYAVNLTWDFKIDFGNELFLEAQAYKFASNEYRLFPLKARFNLCQILSQNEFGFSNIYNCGNAPRCPMKKGHYLICNWGPDYDKFPPHAPVGRYMLEIAYVFRSKTMFSFNWYVRIDPPPIKVH